MLPLSGAGLTRELRLRMRHGSRRRVGLSGITVPGVAVALLAALLIGAPAVGRTQVAAASSPCADTVASGYTVHTCLTAPGDGATVTGVTTVGATTQVTAGATKVRNVVFSLAAE